MDYFKAFETIKSALEKAKIPVSDGHFALQVRLLDDDCGGIFYVEKKDKTLYVEPYDYRDNDADMGIFLKDAKNLFSGKLDVKKAFTEGLFTVDGDAEGLFELIASIPVKKSPARKPAAKKAAPKKETAKKEPAKKAVKKTETKKPSKAAEKKTEAVKVTKETKKAAEKTNNEPIKEVVKKEIKPEKK